MKAILMSVFILVSYPDIKLVQEKYYPTRVACEIQEGILNYKTTRFDYPQPSDFIEFENLIVQFIGANCVDKIIPAFSK